MSKLLGRLHRMAEQEEICNCEGWKCPPEPIFKELEAHISALEAEIRRLEEERDGAKRAMIRMQDDWDKDLLKHTVAIRADRDDALSRLAAVGEIANRGTGILIPVDRAAVYSARMDLIRNVLSPSFACPGCEGKTDPEIICVSCGSFDAECGIHLGESYCGKCGGELVPITGLCDAIVNLRYDNTAKDRQLESAREAWDRVKECFFESVEFSDPVLRKPDTALADQPDPGADKEGG